MPMAPCNLKNIPRTVALEGQIDDQSFSSPMMKVCFSQMMVGTRPGYRRETTKRKRQGGNGLGFLFTIVKAAETQPVVASKRTAEWVGWSWCLSRDGRVFWVWEGGRTLEWYETPRASGEKSSAYCGSPLPRILFFVLLWQCHGSFNICWRCLYAEDALRVAKMNKEEGISLFSEMAGTTREALLLYQSRNILQKGGSCYRTYQKDLKKNSRSVGGAEPVA